MVTTSREVYLRAHGLVDRVNTTTPLHAGWKGAALDGKYYLQVRWAHPDYARLFLKLWRLYIDQYLRLPSTPSHPWAWVSFQKGHEGKPLKMQRYLAAYDRAIVKIGLLPKKSAGTTPHGHRHSYTMWLENLGLSPQHIRRFLHHWSVGSQNTYKRHTEEELHEAVEKGMARLAAGKTPVIYSQKDQNGDERSYQAALKHGISKDYTRDLLTMWASHFGDMP